jgi:hypothetical protein
MFGKVDSEEQEEVGKMPAKKRHKVAGKAKKTAKKKGTKKRHHKKVAVKA